MSDQTRASLAHARPSASDDALDPGDRDILRSLAERVAELAARPGEAAKRALWTDHNDLRPTRPLIFCDPENGWNEILPDHELRCRGDLARTWEMTLRKEVFWGESMGDDRVVEPVFDVPHVREESDWGMHERKIGGAGGGSYTWEAPLKNYSLMENLHFPVIAVDRPATERLLGLVRSVLGDLLEVRLRTRWWWTLGMTWTLVNLRGLEQTLFDMVDHPGELKRLMAFLRDGHLAKLDFLEANGLLAANHDGSYVGSGGFGYTRQLPQDGFDPGRVRTKDMWGFCESQETAGVSTGMFAEFVYPYQVPLLERFGLNCYGCCEPLDRRWAVIKGAPGLRRVSVSPWADLKSMAGELEDKFIFSYKPSPADLAMPKMNEEKVRSGLREALQVTRGCHLEIIMKDNHTLGNNPANASRWCRIAREEIERAAGSEGARA